MGRGIPMLLGGVAAGLVASRVVPPIVAMMVGQRRSRMNGDPFALLIDDHRKILSILDEMGAKSDDSKVKRGRLFLMLKRKLAKHAMAEEDVVYPIVKPNGTGSNERKHLYDEHADMKVLLHTIEHQLMSGENWSSAVSSLRDLVRRHADEEENIIFPELRRQLSPTKMPKVSGEIWREEALIV